MIKKNKILILFAILFVSAAGVLFYFWPQLSRYYQLFKYAGNFDYEVFSDEYQKDYVYPEQKFLDVQKYELKIKIDFNRETIKATANLFIKIKKNGLNKIVLNFRKGLIIDLLLVNNIKEKFKWANDHLIIEGVKGNGIINLTIDYHGKPENSGLGSFVFSKFNGRKYLYTINEPVYASSWFPCNDLPTDKALFRISIEAPKENISISNGKLVSIKDEGLNKIFFWKSQYPIATYLVAIYSGKYSEIKDSISLKNQKLLIENYVFPEDSVNALVDLRIQKKGLKIFSDMFGDYPFIKEKYGVVEITWPLGGIENQTVSGIGAKYFTGENLFEDLFLHELAHQWWGNAVTLSNWKEIWMNEGFAVYSVGLFDEKAYGRNSLEAFMYEKKEDFNNGTLEEPGRYGLSNLTYFKGAWVLHMLRGVIGDNLFFKLLKTYYSSLKFKNSSTKAFFSLIEKLSGKNLNYFKEQWLNKKGIINLIVKWKSNFVKKSKYIVTIKLKQFGRFNNYHFPVELKFVNKEKTKFVRQIFFINNTDTLINYSISFMPDSLIVDPEVKLLAHYKVVKL